MNAGTTAFSVGLDLGQAGEFSALSAVEVHEPDPRYRWSREPQQERQLYLRYLQRWPRGASYAEIAADVSSLLGTPPLKNAALVVDQTGAGRPVVDMVRKQIRQLIREVRLVRVTITGGHTTHYNSDCYVPKTELVSVMQVLLQSRRLHFAKGLAHGEVLVKELQNFRIKRPAPTTEQMIDWREGEDDDLVFAVALACWRAERRLRAGALL